MAQAEAKARQQPEAAPATCALCGRVLGRKIEWHHVVPKSRGGTETVAVHPICHRTIHACVSNQELATVYADLEALRGREDIARFVTWVADKPADFHAPTKKAREE